MFVDPTSKVGFDAASEFSDYHNGEVLDWSLKITGTDDETTRIEKTAVLTRRHKSEKPSTEGIIHTNVFNRSKRNQVRSRIETRDNTAGVSAPEHYVSARACRTTSKGRTHQLVSHDVSAVSFRTWLERDVRVKPPKDFRLCDDWLRCVMKAFLILSPGTSQERSILRRILRWSTDDVHETTDVERVECSEVKGAKMSSKSSPWITGRDASELLTTAETVISRRLWRLVCISDRAVLIISLRRESLPKTCRN